MSPYGEGLSLLSLSITGYFFAPIHHYYAGIKRFLVNKLLAPLANSVEKFMNRLVQRLKNLIIYNCVKSSVVISDN